MRVLYLGKEKTASDGHAITSARKLRHLCFYVLLVQPSVKKTDQNKIRIKIENTKRIKATRSINLVDIPLINNKLRVFLYGLFRARKESK